MSSPPLPVPRGAFVRPTIPSRYLREMVTRSRSGREISARALAQAGLPECTLDVPRSRVSALQFERFYRALRRAIADEVFGYFARPVPPGSYATLLHLLAGAADIGASIDAAGRFYRLFDRHRYWRLEIERETAVLSVVPRDAGQASSLFFAHAMLLGPWRTFAWLAGRPLSLTGLELPPRLRRYASQARYLFGCEPSFVPGQLALRFPADLVGLPVTREAREADEFAQSSLFHLLGPPPRATFEHELRGLLAATRPLADCTLADVARRLGMSRATMARRLRHHGIAFQQLKDEVRRDHAIALLSTTTASLAEIAHQVGYSEPSAFARAFRAWTGLPPGRYRTDRTR